VYFGIGYPERWPRYASLVVNAAIPSATGCGSRSGTTAKSRRAWGSRGSRGVVDHAADAGRRVVFNQNAYNFAAALLQPPKYDAAASDAANYGAIGAIVGHELSHFVDTLGADYDASGNKVRWWTAADLAGYDAATAPLVRQYSNYSIPSGDTSTASSCWWRTWRIWPGSAPRTTRTAGRSETRWTRSPPAGRTASSSWVTRAPGAAATPRMACASRRPPIMPPERFRIATVRNFDAWYTAFDVKPGQTLYLEPKARVHVW
jgi:predicted metalloendopeptidase